MKEFRAEVCSEDDLSEDELDDLIGCLSAEPEQNCVCLEQRGGELIAVLFIEAANMIGAIAAASEMFERHCDRTICRVTATPVAQGEVVEQEPIILIQAGYKTVDEYAHMSGEERVVYMLVRVLEHYGKVPTAKHVREQLSEKVRTIADLMHAEHLDEVLQTLVDKGYLSAYRNDAGPSEYVDTSKPIVGEEGS